MLFLVPLVGVFPFTITGLKDLPGETIPGGLLKLKTEEPPGPVGVAGRGPGEAAGCVRVCVSTCVCMCVRVHSNNH